MNAFNRLTVRLKDGISRLDARLHQKFSYRLIKRTFREFSKDEVTDRSAAVAYYVVLSLFPLLIGLISLLGFFLPIGTVEETVSKALEQALPASTSLIEDNLNNIVQFRGPGAIISVVLLLWSGSNLFAAVGRSVNRAWDIKKDRPFIKKKALHVGMVLATGLLLLLSLGITTAVNLIEEFDGLAIFWLIEIGGYIMGFALVFLVLLLIYKFIPNRKTTWGMTWPGALLSAVLFELAKQGFVWYLANFANYNRLYGSLASLIILVFWIYLSAVIVLLGVEFNAELHKMRSGEENTKV